MSETLGFIIVLISITIVSAWGAWKMKNYDTRNKD